MKPSIHSYYTRSSTKREMVFARKSGKSDSQEEESRHWMNKPPHSGEIGEVEGAHGDRARSTRRRSHTPVRKGTLERRFNELIMAITSMIGAITSMQQQLNRHLGEHARSDRRDTTHVILGRAETHFGAHGVTGKPHNWLGVTRSPHVLLEMIGMRSVRRIGSRVSEDLGAYEIESPHTVDPQFDQSQQL